MITSITKSSKKCAIFEFLAGILHYHWCVYVMCVIYVLSYFSSALTLCLVYKLSRDRSVEERGQKRGLLD